MAIGINPKASGARRSSAEAQVGKRREIRLPVQLFATLAEAAAEPVPVQVSDLSRGGARCATPFRPKVGTAVKLRLDGLVVEAVVRWVSGSACGMEFVEPIRATDLLVQSGKSRRAPANDGERPPLRASAGHPMRLTS